MHTPMGPWVRGGKNWTVREGYVTDSPRPMDADRGVVDRAKLLEVYGLLMLLDRDTRRSPRTRVSAVITRLSAHCSLLRTHKPGSPLLLCPARALIPLRPVPQPILDLL